MSKKPLFYLTRDVDGLFLWFGIDRPAMHAKRRRFQALSSRIRLPLSWYGEAVSVGEIRVVDPDEILGRRNRAMPVA